MNTNQTTTDSSHPAGCQYVLCRQADFWEVTIKGPTGRFKHELGALYVAYLLSEPPRNPIHGVALALKAREKFGQPPGPAEALEQRMMGLEDAESVRALWLRQRELERVLEDKHEIEPVKAEALRELEGLTERLRQSPWLSRHGAERCARAVAVAIQRLHARLAAAVDAAGTPDEVLRAFALHLQAHLLAPSGRDGNCRRGQSWAPAGCFIYVPPQSVVWEVSSLESKVQSPRSKVQGLEPEVRSPRFGVQGSGFEVQGSKFDVEHPSDRRVAVDYLARFLCAGFVLVLMATGCAGRPLKGGRAVTTRKPAGAVEQTLVQGENPSQASKQDQESVKVRTYTVPAGSWVESRAGVSPASESRQGQAGRPPYSGAAKVQVRPDEQQPSTLNSQPSTAFLISSPMPVVEREETKARTELGAAQKDTARELGAKLSSLRTPDLMEFGWHRSAEK